MQYTSAYLLGCEKAFREYGLKTAESSWGSTGAGIAGGVLGLSAASNINKILREPENLNQKLYGHLKSQVLDFDDLIGAYPHSKGVNFDYKNPLHNKFTDNLKAHYLDLHNKLGKSRKLIDDVVPLLDRGANKRLLVALGRLAGGTYGGYRLGKNLYNKYSK